MFVLGTAGHVDHGKSSLLRALTGLEPDRLREEKQRGMTIELNFVWLDSAEFGRVGIVDVPGHQRFVKNMVNGVVSLDAFLFVVAADDSWMPQSEEHLNILKALGVAHGLVIITKSDLVSPEHLSDVEAEVREKFALAGFSGLSVLPFSIHQPVIAVRLALEAMLKQLPAPKTSAYGRLWVDRVFTPRGLGVVATGTLREGALKKGDVLWAWPSGRKGMVKSLQAYGETKLEIFPVSRLAVQLSGLGSNGVGRGTLLCTRMPKLTSNFEAQVQFWKKVPARNFKVAFHYGTEKTLALVIGLGIIDGVGHGCRIKLESPWPLRSGERFLLRAAGEEQTIGAGIVVDTNPPKATKAQALLRLSNFSDSYEGWRNYLQAKSPLLDSDEIQNAIYNSKDTEHKLCDSKFTATTKELNQRFRVSLNAWIKVKPALDQLLTDRVGARRKPFTATELRSVIENSLGWRGEEGEECRWLGPLLEALCDDNSLVRSGEGYLPKNLKREVSQVETKWRTEILEMLRAGAPAPVNLALWFENKKVKREVAHLMSREGLVIYLREAFFLETSAMIQYRVRVKAILTENGQASTKELRDLFGLAREQTVMILEKLDGEGLTYFKDNVRKLNKNIF